MSAVQMARRVEQDLLPKLRNLPGFLAYYVLDTDDRTLATISIFETREAAEQSTRAAKAWLKKNREAMGEPKLRVTTGEVKLQNLAESAVAAL
jgi:heme-degrading monooxygenase HmoA